MKEIVHSTQSNKIVMHLTKISDGLPFTGITNATSGLKINVRQDIETTGTNYTGANIEDMTGTLGVYQAPSSGKIRIKEISSSNCPGDYELHVEDSRFSAVGAEELVINISGVSDLSVDPLRIALVSPPTLAEIAAAIWDLADGIESGLTPRQAFRGLFDAQYGLTSGMQEGSTQVTVKNRAGTKNRGVVTVDGSGNRTAIVSNDFS